MHEGFPVEEYVTELTNDMLDCVEMIVLVLNEMLVLIRNYVEVDMTIYEETAVDGGRKMGSASCVCDDKGKLSDSIAVGASWLGPGIGVSLGVDSGGGEDEGGNEHGEEGLRDVMTHKHNYAREWCKLHIG